MFGIPGELTVTVFEKPRFYSLYAAGAHERKYFDREARVTSLAYGPGAVVALFYTYPARRAAALVRNDRETAAFPGLSKKVRPLLRADASKTDKLRRALSRLDEKHGGAFAFPDDFYTRLAFLLERRGKLDYHALDALAERYQNQKE